MGRMTPELLHQQLKCCICGLCRLDNLPKHLDVEMPDQPLPMGQVNGVLGQRADGGNMCSVSSFFCMTSATCAIENLDHYEMKEEPISGKKLEDEGIEKENWAILKKIRKTERLQCLGQCKLQIDLWRSSGTYTDRRIIRQVDSDSPLHSDLQILKDKQGIGDILFIF
ncbi:ubiquitin-conjugating enzyme E2 Q2-like [Trachypithecus francoisi]|uniref:ubiquitin-conjugating enzyme E2 Q2-like n=1 Tax=Trachypithecus francoisi TaxID=54180 RepID=UPI00141A85E4|nr:ubiquitin-conjugating enzyme E2 Q2-like [Trachypithecus francoisi]